MSSQKSARMLRSCATPQSSRRTTDGCARFRARSGRRLHRRRALRLGRGASPTRSNARPLLLRPVSVSHAASVASTAASSRSDSTMSATVNQSSVTRPIESLSLRSNLQRARYSSVCAKSTPGKPLSRSLSSKRGSVGSHSLPDRARTSHTVGLERESSSMHERAAGMHAGTNVAGRRAPRAEDFVNLEQLPAIRQAAAHLRRGGRGSR